MGMRTFGSASLCTSIGVKNIKDPDPERYQLLDVLEMGKYCIVKARYYGCTNYQGIKLMVFEGVGEKEIRAWRVIDPHFLPNSKIIARFVPTMAGQLMAVEFVRGLIK